MTTETLRVVLDVNVYVRLFLAIKARRKQTSNQRVFEAVRTGKIGELAAQLVISVQMLGKLRDVLKRFEAATTQIDEITSVILSVVRQGPEPLEPLLVLGGAPNLSIQDIEDGGVLAAAFAAHAHILATDNLEDFKPRGCEIFETARLQLSDGSKRTLTCQILKSPSDWEIAVVHPVDFVRWVGEGRDLSPASIRAMLAK